VSESAHGILATLANTRSSGQGIIPCLSIVIVLQKYSNKPERKSEMTNKEYHAHHAVSKSGLDLINRSPAHFKWVRENPMQQTAAMRIGSLTHLAVLEPDLFQSTCAVIPSIDRRTKQGKADFDAFAAEHPESELITSDEHSRILAIRDAVHAHSMAAKLISKIDAVEVSTFWQDTDTGVDCKCRPDSVLSNGMLIDLKTTTDAGDGFAQSVRKYRYHVQAAFYGDGMGSMETRPMVFIAVETQPPYLVACHMIAPDSLQCGRESYKRNLETYAKCMESGNWYGYAETIHQVELPSWVLEEE
jgi:exodeoxyribonuclease VIII